jgi:hypothetical protein
MARRRRKKRRPPFLRKPRLHIEEILRWADAWKARTGSWPGQTSGPIPESPGDTWSIINAALTQACRGLPWGFTLSRLLAKRRGVRKRPPPLKLSKILEWADAHHRRTGHWPNRSSGPILESPGDKWATISVDLNTGYRGLPPGPTLAQLLAEHRGVRNIRGLPRFEIPAILAWADAYHRRTGGWPHAGSGPIGDAASETWAAVNTALSRGTRGLPGGTSLARLLAQKRGRPFGHGKPKLSVGLILSWADAHYRRTGAWPWVRSGAIHKGSGETWIRVERALRQGYRGLAGGSSLFQFLVAHGRIKKPLRLQGLGRRRARAGLSRRELAKQVGVVLSAVELWESTGRLPRPADLAAVARVLAVPVGRLRAEIKAAREAWRKRTAEKHQGGVTGGRVSRPFHRRSDRGSARVRA